MAHIEDYTYMLKMLKCPSYTLQSEMLLLNVEAFLADLAALGVPVATYIFVTYYLH